MCSSDLKVSNQLSKKVLCLFLDEFYIVYFVAYRFVFSLGKLTDRLNVVAAEFGG